MNPYYCRMQTWGASVNNNGSAATPRYGNALFFDSFYPAGNLGPWTIGTSSLFGSPEGHAVLDDLATLMAGTTRTDIFYIKKWKQHQKLTNMTSVGCTMTFYFCETRKSVLANALGTNNDAFPLGILLEGWERNGYTYSSTVTDPPMPMDITPFDSSHFCSHFKIKKVKTAKLLPNSTVDIVLRGGHRKVRLGDYHLDTGNIAFNLIRGDQFLLWKAVWNPVIANATGATPGADTTFPRGSIRVAGVNKLWFQRNNYDTNSLSIVKGNGFAQVDTATIAAPVQMALEPDVAAETAPFTSNLAL